MTNPERFFETEKNWVVKRQSDVPDPAVMSIAAALGVDPVVAGLLYDRGYRTPKDAKSFLCMESEMLCDPYLLKDVSAAIDRITLAARQKQKIMIYGDYDVDGVTSVCVLYLYLSSIGGDVSYYIPTRGGEGHGVSRHIIDQFAEQGGRLIITVDTGITAVEEVAYAQTRGVDFVVTDHHECHSDIPAAVAVVNPRQQDCPYPYKDLAGVGVVFKLICAVEQTLSGRSMLECVASLCESYADLVTLGTIADVMPITGENRLIVAYGLRLMEKRRRLGLEALIEASQSKSDSRTATGVKRIPKINSSFIGYTIAPRINAAGRMLSASDAVELFLTDDRSHADEIAKKLCDANKERQEEENLIMTEALDMIDKDYDFSRHPFLVLHSDFWHQGVIGIVASRLTEKFGVPAILISFDGCDPDSHTDDDMGKGSGRSIKGVNLVDALCRCSDILPKFGGHELAAGLSIRRGDVSLLRQRLIEYTREQLDEHPAANVVEIDAQIKAHSISMEVASDLQKMEPFGAGNGVPLFLTTEMLLKEIIPVTGGRHSKLILGDDTMSVCGMFFSCPPSLLPFYPGDRVDVVYSMEINSYNGKKSVQMILRDIRRADSDLQRDEDAKTRFEEIWNGARFSESENVVPDREDFAAVYVFLRNVSRNGINRLPQRTILSQLKIRGSSASSARMNYVKLKFIFRILQEMNLLGIEEYMPENYRFEIRFSDEKVDLKKSNILRRLRSQQL